MQINKIDLAKTISDFLYLNIENPEEKAKKLFKLKHSLDNKWHWFEKYIQYYFEKFHKYKTVLNWKTNQQDNWIDIKWIKKDNWKEKYLIVQCKNYKIKDITYNDVAHFYWKIVDYKNKYNTEIYYITTTKFTKKAEDFLKEKWINSVNFEWISKLQDLYPLKKFKQDLFKKEWGKEVSKSFSKEQLRFDLDDDIINTIEASDNEVFQLLRQVRRDFSNAKQLELGRIARNDTLQLLARKRPHNLQALKEITKELSTREKNKLDKYWYIFTQRLKYLHKEEFKKEILKNDNFFKKLFNLI